VPQVSVRPAHAPHQPPASSLSEPHSFPPAVPAATGQLSHSRMRPPAVAARTVCGLGGWYVRRGPRGPQLPPRAARRKVRGSPVTARTRRPMSLSRRRRRSLVAPSARRRYHCAARDGRRRHGRDGPPLRPRRHRQRRRHRPLRWLPQLLHVVRALRPRAPAHARWRPEPSSRRDVTAAGEGAGAYGSAGGVCATRGDAAIACGVVAGAPLRCRARMRGALWLSPGAGLNRKTKSSLLVLPVRSTGTDTCESALMPLVGSVLSITDARKARPSGGTSCIKIH
jgi:hypothetical protein